MFLTTLELFEPADTSPSPNMAPWDSSESFEIIEKKNQCLLEIYRVTVRKVSSEERSWE